MIFPERAVFCDEPFGAAMLPNFEGKAVIRDISMDSEQQAATLNAWHAQFPEAARHYIRALYLEWYNVIAEAECWRLVPAIVPAINSCDVLYYGIQTGRWAGVDWYNPSTDAIFAAERNQIPGAGYLILFGLTF